MGKRRVPSTHWHRIFKEEQRNAILLYALKGRDGNIWWIAKVTTIMGSLTEKIPWTIEKSVQKQ